MKRREFLKTAGLGVGAMALPTLGFDVPSRKGKIIDPGRKMRVACIGCGGKGSVDVRGVSGEQIVGLCDVDAKHAAGTFRKYPDVKRYRDFRQMLIELDDQLDAVVVTTPDHMHFAPAMMAIQMGKHVYIQKPISHTVAEARALTLAAREHEVVTQMGNQGHAGEGIRLLREWIHAGVIGDVHEVHIWTNRPVWPQGIERPATADACPPTLDWNKWLGVAPLRPYSACYAPFNWRGWWDFGCGALGDMGCHMMDAAFWALDLKYPTSVEAVSEGGNAETAPKSSVVTYQFPARDGMPPVKLVWYDGDEKPPRQDELDEGRNLARGGQLIMGDKGTIYDMSDYCRSPRLIPEAKMKEFIPKRPEKTIPRVPGGNPYEEWINGCKGGPVPGSNVDVSGPLTETVLLGNLAIRLGTRIEWDGPNMRCTNDSDANKLVTKQYRVY